MNLAQDELSEKEIRSLLLYIRQILEDPSLYFLWSKTFDTIDFLIADKLTAEYVINENEFHVQCVQIFMNTDCVDILESIIDVFGSYFKYFG